jgi:superfamily II DNA or RNA helicase
MIQLRPYQQDIVSAIRAAWDSGQRNVLAVLPTGGGKTATFAHIMHHHAGASVAIAHRQELVEQISQALAREQVRHRIVASAALVKQCCRAHTEELGACYFDPAAPVGVVGVGTLMSPKRQQALAHWLASVTLWVQDEAHHVLCRNQWGKAAELFPNARGLGVTATPLRADGAGLGREYDGLFDYMVVGPSMRDLITAGYLTDYRIFAPRSDIDLSGVNVTAGGDYSSTKLKTAAQKSHIVGDIVDHYLQIAPGKLGVTFATDVETAGIISGKFNAQGVPAEVVSAKTPASERQSIIRRFRNKELLQLVNCDLFGEGFDLPAIEAVSMGRPTQSYGLYVQQFGRALRIMDGKDKAIIIDHVGNVVRHGLPDAPRPWSLSRRDKRAKAGPSDVEAIKACPECLGVYLRVLPACPECGHKIVPQSRSGPEFVDGDLTELDEATLARMREAVAQVDRDKEEVRLELVQKHAKPMWQLAGVKRHVERQEAQAALREQIAWWAGRQRQQGSSDAESYRRFYLTFGVDVATAKALGTTDAEELSERVAGALA